MPNTIIIVQGAQYGSEGKGGVVGYLAQTRACDVAVRTGSINAGHTVVYNGKKYATQQLPAAWVNPSTQLVIGPGAYIHPLTLAREIDMITEATGEDPRRRITIDYRCHLHHDEDTAYAKDAGRHHLMGATGKGCAEAIARKILTRREELKPNTLAQQVLGDDMRFEDISMGLTVAYVKGAKIVIEGTQGTGLDMHLGPYPYVTSRMTSPANWVAECGLSPTHNYSVLHVVRTMPIRVAGNSGPMRHEQSWLDLARAMNGQLEILDRPPIVNPAAINDWDDACRTVAATKNFNLPKGEDGTRLHRWTAEDRAEFRVASSELHATALGYLKTNAPDSYDSVMGLFETTTVTKKLRRIADLDLDQIRLAAIVERPSDMIVTFFNYLHPQLWGKTASQVRLLWNREMSVDLKTIFNTTLCHILGITVGPDEMQHFVPIGENFEPEVVKES